MQADIHVCPLDIWRGVRHVSTACPIWHALRRAAPNARQIVVGSYNVFFYYDKPQADGRVFEYVVLPQAARQLQEDFDRRGIAMPVRFSIEIPDWAVRN